ncbi:MAG: HDOD domain-containing protein [Planctomycetota bacterium]|nr:MAG: HDOD domain-containing protein [Planctomycetota bacterium]
MAVGTPPRYRILFVDDEPRVLSGLRRMLRPLRHRWDMTFVDSPVEALKRVIAEPFDVIVADMKMPKLTGARLLEEIKKRRPETTRIILSGETEREHILGALGTVHQFLAKPCDTETVRKTIERAHRLRERLQSPRLAGLLGSIDSLPSPPAHFTDLVAALEAPDTDVDVVCDKLCRDPALVARVLRLVNSALFGLRQEVTDLRRAVTLLGFDVVRSLAVSTKVLANYRELPVDAIDFESAWEHAIDVANRAKRLAVARAAPEAVVQQAFLGGLLHDTGKLAFAVGLGPRYAEVLALARTESCRLDEAERRLLGADHAEIGGCLLALWSLPDSIVDVVSHHHHPQPLADGEHFEAAVCVHAANILSHLETEPAATPRGLVTASEWSHLEAVGLAEEVRTAMAPAAASGATARGAQQGQGN